MKVRHLANPFKLLDKTFYTEYRAYNDKKKLPKEYRIVGRDKASKVLSTILKHVAKNLVEREGGVLIQKLGYFFIWKMPKKLVNTKMYKVTEEGGVENFEMYNHHTNNYMFSPIFLPIMDKNRSFKLGRWTMDNSFSAPLKKEVNKKIRAGHKYKMFAYSISKLYRV